MSNESKNLIEAAFLAAIVFIRAYIKVISASLELSFLDSYRNQVKLADKPGSVVDSHSSRRFVT
ncbi:hypothetical protein W01_19630 [Candidatus Nitrotoga sp. AM1P]|nr:hypothetical protein W01_19630 [Candidatus Nitrotoga sp. AM1P]